MTTIKNEALIPIAEGQPIKVIITNGMMVLTLSDLDGVERSIRVDNGKPAVVYYIKVYQVKSEFIKREKI